MKITPPVGPLLAVSATTVEWAGDGAVPAHSTVVALTANSSTLPGGVIFMGDDTHLLSASGDKLTVWDLHQLTRIATQARMTMPWACSACPPPLIQTRPDGKAIAVLSGNRNLVSVRSLDPPGQERTYNDSYTHFGWSADSSALVLVKDGGSYQIRAAGTGRQMRGTVKFGPYGQLRVRYLASGHLERVIANPATMSTDGGTLTDPAGTVSATFGDTSVTLTDLRSGQRRTVHTGPMNINDAALSSSHMVVLLRTGQLEVRDPLTGALQRSINQGSSYLPTAANVETPLQTVGQLLIQQRSNGSLTVTDLTSGDVLGALTLPTDTAGLKTGLAFTQDGRRLITVTEGNNEQGTDALLGVWSMSADSWIKIACASAGRNLTAGEWRQYVGASLPADLTCAP